MAKPERLRADDEAEAEAIVADRLARGWRLLRRDVWPDGSVAIEMRAPRSGQSARRG